MGKKEILFGGVLMALSIIIFALTYQFPKQTIALPPTVYPRFVSSCLFILALILTIQGMIGAKKGSGQQKPPTTLDTGFLIRLISLIILAFVYTRVLSRTGYVLATPPFVAGTMIIFNEKRWIWIVAVSLITSGVLYVLFRMLFKVPLPRFDLW
ncbi:hypothetical protein GF339_19610 [candidate division KSB3 bacterium]|uniref:DUF1468 domain-containing protein n=1 Tax=candidate division KSB3 bacterium TaxID=2044937 RepID=A0A9D5JZT2_9BACT|nr:hypothetical protein [candidate division KSB3 bacterium]MBD3326801.1 hypothetical protein [candidate division KSB3 bacterium]